MAASGTSWALVAGTALVAGGIGAGLATWLHGHALWETPPVAAVSAKVDKMAQTEETSTSRERTRRTPPARPRVTQRWLVGRWTMPPGDPCDDPGGINLMRDGTFGQDEGGGHYRLSTGRIIFDDFFSWGDTPDEHVPDPDPANIQPIRAVDADTMVIGTSRYVRCRKAKPG